MAIEVENLEHAQGQAAGVTSKVVDFVLSTDFDDLPSEVVQLSKHSFLDTLGICLGGAGEQAPRILAGLIKEGGGRAVSTAIGQGFRTTPQQAAWINGVAADIHGFSDISVLNMNHPSVSIYPAIWAVAEARGSSGREMLLAHALGVEIADQISYAVKPGFQIQGWHPLAVLNTFGSAVAVGKLLGLQHERMGWALGIAGAEASGMRSGMGTMSKAYGAGRAARDGIVAAMLAEKGFTGPEGVLEIKDGFMQTFGNGADPAKVLEGLGNPFALVSPGITYKAYPSCTRSHPGITGVLSLMKEHGITAKDVESVDCAVTIAVDNYLKFHRPETKFQAKYSMEFCVAAALLDGKITIPTFTDDRVHDPEVVQLMERVKSYVSPELASYGYMPEHAPHGCTVTIQLKDGRELVRRVDRGPWERQTPPSWNDLVGKFRDCCEGVLSAEQQDEVIAIVEDVERAKNISRLMAIVSGESR